MSNGSIILTMNRKVKELKKSVKKIKRISQLPNYELLMAVLPDINQTFYN